MSTLFRYRVSITIVSCSRRNWSIKLQVSVCLCSKALDVSNIDREFTLCARKKSAIGTNRTSCIIVRSIPIKLTKRKKIDWRRFCQREIFRFSLIFLNRTEENFFRHRSMLTFVKITIFFSVWRNNSMKTNRQNLLSKTNQRISSIRCLKICLFPLSQTWTIFFSKNLI